MWVEVDRTDGCGGWVHSISISWDIITITSFEGVTSPSFTNIYISDLDELIPLQDSVPTTWDLSSMNLRNDYIVYLDWDEYNAFVYRWEWANNVFAFHQQINIFMILTIIN